MIENPVETLLTSIEGTKNILNLAREKKCISVVYISSMEMYGAFNISKEVRENDLGFIDNLKVRSNYPESKRLCENMCVAYCSEYGVHNLQEVPCRGKILFYTRKDNQKETIAIQEIVLLDCLQFC